MGGAVKDWMTAAFIGGSGMDLILTVQSLDCGVMMVARDVGPEVRDGWIDADSERAVKGCACGD